MYGNVRKRSPLAAFVCTAHRSPARPLCIGGAVLGSSHMTQSTPWQCRTAASRQQRVGTAPDRPFRPSATVPAQCHRAGPVPPVPVQSHPRRPSGSPAGPVPFGCMRGWTAARMQACSPEGSAKGCLGLALLALVLVVAGELLRLDVLTQRLLQRRHRHGAANKHTSPAAARPATAGDYLLLRTPQ